MPQLGTLAHAALLSGAREPRTLADLEEEYGPNRPGRGGTPARKAMADELHLTGTARRSFMRDLQRWSHGVAPVDKPGSPLRRLMFAVQQRWRERHLDALADRIRERGIRVNRIKGNVGIDSPKQSDAGRARDFNRRTSRGPTTAAFHLTPAELNIHVQGEHGRYRGLLAALESEDWEGVGNAIVTAFIGKYTNVSGYPAVAEELEIFDVEIP
jgi:hypothetical protein